MQSFEILLLLCKINTLNNPHKIKMDELRKFLHELQIIFKAYLIKYFLYTIIIVDFHLKKNYHRFI